MNVKNKNIFDWCYFLSLKHVSTKSCFNEFNILSSWNHCPDG